MIFQEVTQDYKQYKEHRRQLKNEIRKWLYSNGYHCSVRVDSDRITLKSSGYNNTLDSEVLLSFMKTFQVTLIYSDCRCTNNISDEDSVYPIGEYYEYKYYFR